MNKYAKAAILAITHHNKNDVKDIVKSWDSATMKVFPTQEPSRKKGCPKSAFFGLCEVGYVKGVSQGEYLKRNNSLNKDYAIKAVNILKGNPRLADGSPKNLWKLVMNGILKTPNSQMDIVLALWNEKLIELRNNTDENNT